MKSILPLLSALTLTLTVSGQTTKINDRIMKSAAEGSVTYYDLYTDLHRKIGRAHV